MTSQSQADFKDVDTPNAKQIGGSHYKDRGIQPWDYIVSNGMTYLQGNAIKYLSRYKSKGGVEDLEKAKHYIDKIIEVEYDMA